MALSTCSHSESQHAGTRMVHSVFTDDSMACSDKIWVCLKIGYTSIPAYPHPISFNGKSNDLEVMLSTAQPINGTCFPYFSWPNLKSRSQHWRIIGTFGRFWAVFEPGLIKDLEEIWVSPVSPGIDERRIGQATRRMILAFFEVSWLAQPSQHSELNLSEGCTTSCYGFLKDTIWHPNLRDNPWESHPPFILNTPLLWSQRC